MKKFSLIMNYISSFIIMILLLLLVIICILKFSIFNKNYLYNEIEINYYYDNLYKEINEEIDSYIISSGFDRKIVSNLYTKEELISDVNLFIENYYSGKETILNKDEMYQKLDMKIKQIEEKENLQILDTNSIESFILDIVNIYQNEINLYGFLNGFITSFVKFEKLIDNFLVFLVLLLLFLIPLIKTCLPNNFLSSSIMSVGIILIIIKIFLYERIDVGNILIITKNFSIILNNIVENIGKFVYIISLELILIGIFLMLKSVKRHNI